MELKPIFALLVVLGLVIGVNLVALLRFRAGRGEQNGIIQFIRLGQKAAGRARNPWEQEDQALKELSQMVGELKHPEPDQGELPR